MPLTDLALRSAKPRGKSYKIFDAGGLYVLVHGNGSRYWRFDYRYRGKRRTLALGLYPAVSLVAARKQRDAAKELLAKGADPSVTRRLDRHAGEVKAANTFEAVAREWLSLQANQFAPATLSKANWMLFALACPLIGNRPIADIGPPEVLHMLRQIEGRGFLETAHRVKARCGQVFRYAIATGRAQRDPCADLRGALAPNVSRHHAAITDPKRIGELLRAIDGYSGHPITGYALKLSPLVFLRPGELRKGEWDELDFETSEWRLPANRMKMDEAHVVPLARQAIALLRELRELSGGKRYMFPSLRTWLRPMSENTVNAALRRLGYATTEMTGHGFRTLASTRLNEMGWSPDVIERQLAHGERNRVRAAYNRAQYLGERRRMMQAWADYLDGLRAAGSDRSG